MISGENFYLLAALKHDINESVQILWLLRFLPDFSKYRIPANPMPYFHLLARESSSLTFIPNKANLVRVHEIISVR
jgi:hypothetical protein